MSTPEKNFGYQAALDWLWSLVTDPEGRRFMVQKTHAQRRREMAAQLARTSAFLAYAGHPERRVPLIHVTGTSGKGSVTTMIAHLLRQQGFNVAHHTSPYLQSPREKLVFNDARVSPAEFAGVVDKLREWVTRWNTGPGRDRPLKYGEAWVALTYLWLAEVAPDWGVVEAGMGGRFDPTNAAPARLAVITNVARDHLNSLGPGLRDVAWHKAGIIRSKRPALTGVTDPDLLTILQQEADSQGSRLFALDRDFTFEEHADGSLTVDAPFGRYAQIEVGPAGRFQRLNAALAIAAVDVLCEGRVDRPLSLGKYAFPGRMEIVSQDPLVILDGAHNPHKMAALVESVVELVGDRPKVALVGGIANKEVADTVRPLAEICRQVIVTRPRVAGKPAAPPAEVVATLQRTLPDKSFAIAADADRAIEAILADLPADGCLIISGSLYLVGQARERWYPSTN